MSPRPSCPSLGRRSLDSALVWLLARKDPLATALFFQRTRSHRSALSRPLHWNQSWLDVPLRAVVPRHPLSAGHRLLPSLPFPSTPASSWFSRVLTPVSTCRAGATLMGRPTGVVPGETGPGSVLVERLEQSAPTRQKSRRIQPKKESGSGQSKSNERNVSITSLLNWQQDRSGIKKERTSRTNRSTVEETLLGQEKMDDGVNAYFGAGGQDGSVNTRANGRVTRGTYSTDVPQDVEELVQQAKRALNTAEKQLEYVEADESEQLKALAQAEKRYNVANKNVHDCYNKLQDARREAQASLEMLESVKDSLTRAELRKMEANREKERCIFMLDSTRKVGGMQNVPPAPTAPAPPRDSAPAYPPRHQPYSSNTQQPYSQHPSQAGVHFQDAPDERQMYGTGAGRRNMSATLASRLASVRSKSNVPEDPRANNPYAPKPSRDYEQAYCPPPPPVPPQTKPEDEAPVELKDSTRTKLEQTMEPFMPRAHYLKNHLSMLPGIREKIPRPGFICNRTCDLACLCQSATGFLAMADIEILQDNAPPDMLITALTKARRKYHPDKNRIEVVGEEEFHHAEEMCKIASSLVNLFKEAENINIVAHLLPQDLKLKFQMSMKDTVETIKHRIEEEESIPRGTLTVTLGQHPLADHLTLNQCNIMEMAVVTVTSGRPVRDGRRPHF